MGTKVIFTTVMIGNIQLEMDINNEPRIVMKDEMGQEWVLSEENTSHGLLTQVIKKEKCWFFDEKNRTKEIKGF